MTNGLLYRYRVFAKCISPITLKRKLAQLTRSETASTAIEFAIILPVVVLFVLGIISFGAVIYESSDLQGALNDAARQGKTGYPNVLDNGVKTSAPNSRWGSVYSNFTGQTKFLFDPNKIGYSATTYPDFTSAAKEAGGTPDCIGGSGKVVVYKAWYPYPNIPFVQFLFGKGNNMQATVVVKNEVFQ
ncbi:MAG TPA: TadE family protein [Rickettsiales bacterium]|nr:TadE family protein [Rickettsiales bacterium]